MPLQLKRKYFGDRGNYTSYLEKPEIVSLYSLLDVANYTEGV